SRSRLRLGREQALALRALAGELAGAADGFRPFTRLLFGGLFVMTAKLHLAENALSLHLLLQRLEGLVDIVIADENLHACFSSKCGLEMLSAGPGLRPAERGRLPEAWCKVHLHKSKRWIWFPGARG